MKVQRVKLPDGRVSWAVLDGDFVPVQPIQQYIKYLESLEKSPNTIQNYARALKLLWEFLQDYQAEWTEIDLEELAEFISWLRQPDPSIVSIQVREEKRVASTINNILSAVCNFYDFQCRVGNVKDIKAYGSHFQPSRRYKPFLHHISKGKPVQTRLLKLKASRKHPEILTQEQVDKLIDACRSLRDKFLLCLLYETGMRLGQALGLRHCDVRSWDNEIEVVPRKDNANGALAKTKQAYMVHVSKELMRIYSEYLCNEYPLDSGSDYVFVNIQKGCIGAAMNRHNVAALFRRLREETGINCHPHLFRHTHATELIRSGWDASRVQKRLGHASVQTTIDIYSHLNGDDLKAAYNKYLEQRSEE